MVRIAGPVSDRERTLPDERRQGRRPELVALVVAGLAVVVAFAAEPLTSGEGTSTSGSLR